MMYIGIVGSRKRNSNKDYQLVKQHILLFKREFPITLVSGGAKGIDSIAKKIANELNIPIIEFLPNKSEYTYKGNGIYFERNKQIAETSDYLLAYPINNSGGTMNTVKFFIKLGKKENLRIFNKNL